MCHFHGHIAIELIHGWPGIINDGIPEGFEFRLNGIDVFAFRIIDGQGFCALRRFDVKMEQLFVALSFKFDDIGFLFQKINADIRVFLEQADLPHFLHGDA